MFLSKSFSDSNVVNTKEHFPNSINRKLSKVKVQAFITLSLFILSLLQQAPHFLTTMTIMYVFNVEMTCIYKTKRA